MEEKLKKLNGKIKRRLVKLADLQKQYNQKSSKTPTNQLLNNADLALLNAEIVELKSDIAELSFARNDLLRAMGKPSMPIEIPEAESEQNQPCC